VACYDTVVISLETLWHFASVLFKLVGLQPAS
jgi:hypothetical protein